MDEGAWWAAVHGVAKSRTRLKQLSSSSSSAELKLTVILPDHFEAIAQFSCHCCFWEISVCVCVCVCVKSLSHVRLFTTPWTVAHQAPLSMGFSRQGYWSGLSCASPGDLPNPGIKPGSPALQADALSSEPPGKPPGNLFLCR